MHDEDGRPCSKRAEQDRVQRVDVKKRKNAENHIVFAEAKVRIFPFNLLSHAGYLTPVRQHDAFRKPRRAGRIRQRNDVVRTDFHRRDVVLVGLNELREMQNALLVFRIDKHDLDAVLFGKVLDFVHVSGLSYDQLGSGGSGLLRHLRRSIEGIGGGAHGADKRRAEECEDELGTVLEPEHDSIALSDAQLVEPRRDFTGIELDVAVRILFSGAAVDQTRTVFELRYLFEAISVQREVVWDVNVREFRTENVFFMSLFLFGLHFVFGWRESEKAQKQR